MNIFSRNFKSLHFTPLFTTPVISHRCVNTSIGPAVQQCIDTDTDGTLCSIIYEVARLVSTVLSVNYMHVSFFELPVHLAN